MNRKFIDSLLSWVGALLVVVFIAAGALLNLGYSFANSQVHDQLAQQQIFFPKAGSPGFDAATYPELQKYSEMQLTTGQQAADYANFYIGEHLKGIGQGKTYSQASTAARAAGSAAAAADAAALAAPNDAALADAAKAADATAASLSAQVDTLFKGETLRGMLLNAYAFWDLGQIAHFASIGAFIAALLMLILTVIGFRRVTVQGKSS
ncbi:MAG TPA: hypothetical protein VMV52_06845 [Candidatus Nanopelagicaceae bacterium]|nr:hypothetical protein [Candidatus Nanopelagicaceae bacterium]